jgi:hypothetical protein
VSRINVVCDVEFGRIVGYVTLSAAQIERAFLPKPLQRNRPDPVPATLLGQLAVVRAFQGQGHAASLLVFALRTALVASATIGSLGVITHPLDDGVRGFSMCGGGSRTCRSIRGGRCLCGWWICVGASAADYEVGNVAGMPTWRWPPVPAVCPLPARGRTIARHLEAAA